MNSEKNKRGIIVGMFIFIGLAIFIVGVLTLGGQNKSFVKKITVKTIFDDVSGLQAGNNVWFSGVKIGTVKRMSFYGSSQVQVVLSIEEKAQQYIHKNAKAKISTDGLIGNKIIVIDGGTPKVPPIEEGDVLGIDAAVSTDDMMKTFQQNNQNLLAITNDFKNISKNVIEGKGTVGKLLKDETLVDNMQSTLGTLRKASLNAQQLTASLSAFTSDFTAKLNQKGGLVNELVTDTLVFSQVRSTVSQLQEVSGTARDLTNNLKEATNDLKDKNSPVGMLLHDQDAASSLKITLKNLETSTQKLDENMEALQHNFLLRGFFRRKAKAEAKAAKDSANASK